MGMSNMPAISSFVCLDVFGENERRDFCVLIICPEHLQNIWRMFLRFWHSIIFAFEKRKISSAKKRWEILICPINVTR